MNLRDLEYVTAIDRYRNFGKAAEACHVSQPALSAQVKKLEERLGVELFARTNNGVLTTDAGVRIVATAKDVLHSAQRITDTAAEYHDPFAAPLRIGIIPTLAPFIVPYVSKSIKVLSDQLATIYREQPTQTLLAELENRMIDVALVSGPIELSGYKFTPIFRERLMLVVSKTHRLANTDRVTASEIPTEELLLLTEEHCLRAETLSLCQGKNIGIDVPHQILANNFLTMSHYLAEGVGCSLMPMLARPFLEQANPNISFVEIEDEAYGRDIGFLSREGCPREHILMALCDQIRTSPPGNVTSLA
ncbi:LysR substrate-binding domain-containing protein [Erythrobacter sp. F6033]|uniref:LysR substrate-binding domain-containing protein n=1 Tax=Erythrobacter sp. F6033 TaxID=2926401 RepID=UPI001FF2D893|nr:LysR substrate-binding domain-containing protein [Erythrobacter sp. F6033]MCK0127596.1 LysR substrate-binding domain-containing protein [Erythrobacter sp. F6033]